MTRLFCLLLCFLTNFQLNATDLMSKVLQIVGDAVSRRSDEDNEGSRYRHSRRERDDEYEDRGRRNERSRGGEDHEVYNRSRRGNSDDSEETLTTRKKALPTAVIKKIRVAPTGDKIAYVSPDNGCDSVHIVRLNRKSEVIKGNGNIEEIRFVGRDYIVYVYRDSKNFAHLVLINLREKEETDLSPLNNAKSISIAAVGRGKIITISCDGSKYFIDKINLSTGHSELIRRDDAPVIALFDDNLKLRLSYQNVPGRKTDVFFNDESEDGRSIDQIDPSQERCISATENRYCKLSVNPNGTATLTSVNLRNNASNRTDIPDVRDLSSCEIFLDERGHPLIATTTVKGKKANIPLDDFAKRLIQRLNNSFRDSDWSPIGSTDDGNTWLICVYDPRGSNEYYLYDTRNGHRKLVISGRNA